MRHIPPNIWTMAVAVGKLERAYGETKNKTLLAVVVQMRLKINQFLYPIGKDVQK